MGFLYIVLPKIGMDGGIYFDNDGDLIEMSEDLYEREALLQRDLANFPKLLAGDQMDTSEPRRWTLIAREASVPDKEGGNERWSADHLFVDQDAIPTIVEVKRSEDTRRRREVAGQMLDYVSHATLYWDAADLRETFEETCETGGTAQNRNSLNSSETTRKPSMISGNASKQISDPGRFDFSSLRTTFRVSSSV